MLSKNKEYVVDIVDIGQGGVGIGKYEGFTVFVEGGLIQDKVKVRINKSKKNYAVGDIVEIQFGDKVSKFEIIEIPKVQGRNMGELIKIL